MLSRVLKFAQQRFHLLEHVDRLYDSRHEPQIPVSRITRTLLLTVLGRLGSFNAVEQTADQPVWRRWLKGDAPPSADTLGRVAQRLNTAELREVLTQMYRDAKRLKMLSVPPKEFSTLTLDGHDLLRSTRRCCAGCLTRRVACKDAQGRSTTRLEYYHQAVFALLHVGEVTLWLDLEAVQSGEDEVAAALRLLKGLKQRLPRAFEVVLLDSLYAQARVLETVRELGLQAVIGFKHHERELWRDFVGLRDAEDPDLRLPSVTGRPDSRSVIQVWDYEGQPSSWASWNQPVRLVASEERRVVRRQLDRREHEEVHHWAFITTLSRKVVPARKLLELGHRRWDIENQGFNDSVREWHLNHQYRHEANALVVLWLFALLARNVFDLAYRRTIRPRWRRSHSRHTVAQQLHAVFYATNEQDEQVVELVVPKRCRGPTVASTA